MNTNRKWQDRIIEYYGNRIQKHPEEWMEDILAHFEDDMYFLIDETHRVNDNIAFIHYKTGNLFGLFELMPNKDTRISSFTTKQKRLKKAEEILHKRIIGCHLF
jgi:hypothetical protein